MTLGQRIERFIEEIKNKGTKLTYQDIARSINQSVQYLNKIRKDEKIPSVALLKALCYEYNVNYEWLNTGNGPMFLSESQIQLSEKNSSEISYYLEPRLKQQFHELTEEEKVIVVKMVEKLLDIFTIGKKSTQIAIRNNIDEFYRLALADRKGNEPEGNPTTDRASPSDSAKPKNGSSQERKHLGEKRRVGGK